MLNKLLPAALRGRILLCIVIVFALGIIAARYITLSLSVWFALFCLAAAVFVVCFFLRRGMVLLLCLPMAFALGAFLCAGETAALDAWDFTDGHNIILTGKVAAVEPEDDGWRVKLKVDTADGQKLNCAPVYVYGEGSVPTGGSRIEVRGRVYMPRPYGNSNAFDYNDYLRDQGIAGMVSSRFTGSVTELAEGPAFWPGDISLWLRSGLDEAAKNLSEKQRALVYGVFLGDKSSLDYEMKNALGLSGALHAFAVSGLHVGYIAALALLIAGGAYTKRRLRFFVCLGLLVIYVGMTGGAASILRASLMIMCVLLASMLDEKNDTPTALAFAALVCLCIKPLWLFSSGFQLSFAAASGIIIFMPMFRRLMFRLPRRLNDMFSVTFAATLGTLPLICYYFYHISWLGWLLSPVVVLAAGITVILSFAATIFAIFSPWLAGILLHGAAYAMEPAYWLCTLLSSKGAQITGAVFVIAVLLFYILSLFLPRIRSRHGNSACLCCMAALLAAFALFAPVSFSAADLKGEVTEVVFLDVGQGDCAFVLTPDGNTALIDGGGKLFNEGEIGEYTLLPYLKGRGIDHLDLLVSSHPDVDHTDGLISVLKYLDADRLVAANIWQENELFCSMRSLAEENGVEFTDIRRGDVLKLGEYVTLTCYYPGNDMISPDEEDKDGNDFSLVLELSCGDTDILFTGDMGGEKLCRICGEEQAEAEIIKIPHHGSETGYCEQLAEVLGTEAAVISVGEDNSYGHPVPKVVEYWQEHGAVYRTDQNGSVTVYTNGDEYEIVTYY